MSATTQNKVLSLAEMRSAGKMVAKDAGGATVQAFFEANKDTLKALLPQQMKPERMLKIAMNALRTTPKLMQCTVQSLFGAVVHCSQLGLEPNTPQGHIYLIPFENKRKGVTEVQIVVGFKGLVDLARRSGQIVSISARARHRNDEWRMLLGTEDTIHHVPADGDRGEVIGFYAVAKLQGGGVQFEYMGRAEVEKIRDASQGYKSSQRFGSDSPWKSHFDEMAKKTVVRRLCKMLPMSIELADLLTADERGEAGVSQGMDKVLEGEWTAAGEDTAPAEAAGWMLFDADGQVIQADTPARWEAEAKRILASLEDPAALHTWRNEMEGTFADLRSRDAALVQRIEDAAQDRMDELAAGANGGEG